jgi:gamma-glutamylcyclotransferase (GGCT)/AIG2-like uncharacterized protein YtfP
MAKENEYLFVYGTLMKKAGHPMHETLARYAAYVSDAVAEGVLYDLGAYPAMREGEGIVQGELYRIEDPVRLFRVLDRYEGREYERKKVRVTAPGREGEAWAYLYRKPLPPARRIRSGAYLTRGRKT